MPTGVHVTSQSAHVAPDETAELATHGPMAAARDEPRPRESMPDIAELVCPACGRVSALDVRFCATCGFRFKAGEDESVDAPKGSRDQADPLVGRTLADRYQIVELIGRGGMGVVYRVEHTRIAKQMAMKLLHGELARDKEVVRRFRREAEAVSKLDHQNTVQVFDFGRAEGMTYLVMELLPGRDLGAILQQEGTISFTRMAHIAVQICASVQQAHDRGIVHRDLKPENVRILTRQHDPDFVKVLDFGLAKLRDNEETARASITREGFLVGTPYYMAPEHIRGEPVDARSDVYALGALMYKAIVGVPPFSATTPVAVLTKHLHDPVVPPTKRAQRPDLPPAADEILLKALEKKPADRYQSMSELREALATYLGEVGIDVDSGRLREPTLEGRVSSDTQRAVVATRGDVDRYERRLRLAAYAQAMALAMLAALGVFGAVWVYDHGTPHIRALGESEPNDTPEEATPADEGMGLQAYLGARHDHTHGDADVYEIDTTEIAHHAALGTTTMISIESTAPPNIDIELDLYRHDRADAILHVDLGGVGHAERAMNFPVEATRYFLRVREVENGVVFPTENVSDPYEVRWTVRPSAEGEEHEFDDDTTHATALGIGETRHAFIGWNGDRDVFCVDAEAPALAFDVAGAGLDLVLTVREGEGGSEHVMNAPGVGTPEHWTSEGPVPAGTCATITELEGSERTSEDGAYTVHAHAPAAP
jgi:tRNA A-37 threonylcarbamoyl transferase component Bud32